MADLLIKNALLEKKKKNDILILNGDIVEISSSIEKNDIPTINADNHFVCPPFIDSHFHLDATLSYGIPRINQINLVDLEFPKLTKLIWLVWNFPN